MSAAKPSGKKRRRKRRFVAGITGQIGAGKSTAAKAFAARGFKVIDADKTAHSLYGPGTALNRRLRKIYGSGYFLKDGSPDRKKLAERVFKNISEYRKFTSLVYGPLNRKLLSEIKKAGKFAAVDMAVLFESGFYKKVDAVIYVSADAGERHRRVVPVLGEKFVKRAEKFQSAFGNSKKIALSGYILYNDRGIKHLKSQALKIMKKTGV